MAGLPQVLEFYSALKNVPWGKVNGVDLQKWIDDPQRLAIELLKFLKNFPQEETAVEAKSDPILRRLYEDETITIAPCDGSRFIGKQKKTFASFIDGCFESCGLNKSGKPTDATTVSVHEMIRDAKFTEMFGALGSDLDKLCLTQSQIVEFCEKHCDKLRQDGYATFFLFKEGDQFFVAGVRVNSGGLNASVDRFEYDRVWGGEYRHRVVTPHLPAGRQD